MSDIPVIYDDKWLLVADKPAGILTVPAPGKGRRTLTRVINEQARAAGAPELFPCHRLDRETSGVIVFAKGAEARDQMMNLFRSRRVKKTYIAFVHGRISGHGRITIPIEGDEAFTRFHVVRTCGEFSVVKAFPETGRTNQIRIHFKAIGYPIVGETKYSFRRDFPLKAKRAMLHAESLEFDHFAIQRHVRVTAELPEDMRCFLENHG